MKNLILQRLSYLVIAVLCIFGAAVSVLLLVWDVLTGSPRAWRMFLAFDRVGNAATGGSDTETISSRADRARSEGRAWGCVLCRLLDWIQTDHCANSKGK